MNFIKSCSLFRFAVFAIKISNCYIKLNIVFLLSCVACGLLLALSTTTCCMLNIIKY